LPPNLPAGNYEVLINLPDPEPTLFNNPLYSIQLANANTWEASTGYNKLNHTIQVTAGNAISSTNCLGGQMFTSTSVFDPDYCSDILNVNNSIPSDVYGAKDQVISDGVVPTNGFVIFHADEIFLNPGFETMGNSVFWAIILDCFEED